MRATRGTLTEPGIASPYRDRSVAENLDLFRRMRAGEFPDGAHVLRLKIDMASPNINLRDPAIYRIRHARASPHRRQVVHLSALRLHALHLRRARAHHALDLHARVPGPPAAVRLGDRAPRRRRPAAAAAAAAIRVRAAQPHLRRAVQAQADRAGREAATSTAGTTRACRRSSARAGAASRRKASGCSPSASACRRRDSWIDMSVLEDCHARRPQRARASAASRCSIRSSSSSTTIPTGSARTMLRAQPSAAARARQARAAVLARAVDRARRLQRDAAQGLLPPDAGRRGAAALRVHRQVHRASRRTPTGNVSVVHCTYDPRHAQRHAGRRRAQGEGQHPLAVGRRTPCRPKCASTTGCSACRFPARATPGAVRGDVGAAEPAAPRTRRSSPARTTTAATPPSATTSTTSIRTPSA